MKRFLAVFFILAFLLAGVNPVSADEPVVRAILFYSPSCGHCHKVIRETSRRCMRPTVVLKM